MIWNSFLKRQYYCKGLLSDDMIKLVNDLNIYSFFSVQVADYKVI